MPIQNIINQNIFHLSLETSGSEVTCLLVGPAPQWGRRVWGIIIINCNKLNKEINSKKIIVETAD